MIRTKLSISNTLSLFFFFAELANMKFIQQKLILCLR